jgi:DNA ligase D-like protein (predicted polymerase)
MLIRKNTKAFKTIVEIVTACQERADREQLIRLFITKAGNTVVDRISVDSIQGDAALFYEMNYQTVLNSLRSPNHQLNESDEIPGLFYFHSTSNKRWDETPFEFDDAIKTEFKTLPDLPATRKKAKTEKYVLPSAPPPSKSSAKKLDKQVAGTKTKKAVAQRTRQPDFKLKHEIEFSDLDRVIFRQPQLTKEQILTYYYNIADHILPYLKDRRLWVRTKSDRAKSLEQLTTDLLFADEPENIPGWLHPRTLKKGSENDALIIDEKEKLLLAVERGALEFYPELAKLKQVGSPDYFVITIDSPESDIAKAVHVALEAKVILDGLKLPSLIKTDGMSGFHVYVPLEAKASYQHSRDAAKYVCRLISLKLPNLVAIVGSDENSYGKVAIDYTLNEEKQTLVAPYSLVAGETVNIATPLLWDEVNEGLDPASFSIESIFKRLKKNGDPFENLSRKKINAAGLVQSLADNYAFLF